MEILVKWVVIRRRWILLLVSLLRRRWLHWLFQYRRYHPNRQQQQSKDPNHQRERQWPTTSRRLEYGRRRILPVKSDRNRPSCLQSPSWVWLDSTNEPAATALVTHVLTRALTVCWRHLAPPAPWSRPVSSPSPTWPAFRPVKGQLLTWSRPLQRPRFHRPALDEPLWLLKMNSKKTTVRRWTGKRNNN